MPACLGFPIRDLELFVRHWPKYKSYRQYLGRAQLVSAVAASGLPTDKFVFFGFLPKTEVKVVGQLEQAKNIQATAVFYESPQRILKTLGFIAEHFPEAKIAVARD